MKRFILLASTALLVACDPAADTATDMAAVTPATEVAVTAPATVTISRAEVVNNTFAADYTLTWTQDTPGAVRIEASTNPAAAPGEGEVIAYDVTDGRFDWSSGDDMARHYFLIIPDAGEPVRTAARLLPLEGGRNFRDLGGYQTADGRTVKWGQVYRSGRMNNLTSTDYAYLAGLDIDVVCDLRTTEERVAEPTNWAAGDAEYLTFADPEGGADGGELAAVFQDPELTPEKVAVAMTGFYDQIAYQQAPAYREMFDRLAAGDVPLAFNCTAGKDRTGVGAALILTALGVPRDVVVADYALSEVYVDYMADMAEDMAKLEGEPDGPYAFLAKLPPELLAPLMRSDPRYLEAALASMEASHGSVLNFLREEIDVTDAELEAIRARLLTDA